MIEFEKAVEQANNAGWRIDALSQNSEKPLKPEHHKPNYWSAQLRHKGKIEYRNYQARTAADAILGALKHPVQDTGIPFDYDYQPQEEDEEWDDLI